MATRISAVEARKNLGKILNIVNLRNEEIIIERAGKPMAKLVPCNSLTTSTKIQGDFRETRGLGKDLWKNIDVDSYIKREREQWD